MRKRKALTAIDSNSLYPSQSFEADDDEFFMSTREKKLIASGKTPKISNVGTAESIANLGRPPRPRQLYMEPTTRANVTTRRRQGGRHRTTRRSRKNEEESSIMDELKPSSLVSNERQSRRGHLSTRNVPNASQRTERATERAASDAVRREHAVSPVEENQISEMEKQSCYFEEDHHETKPFDLNDYGEDMECASDSASMDSDLSSTDSPPDLTVAAASRKNECRELQSPGKKKANPQTQLHLHCQKVARTAFLSSDQVDPLLSESDLPFSDKVKHPVVPQETNFTAILPSEHYKIPSVQVHVSRKIVGATIGGDMLDQSESLDGSEITLPTIGETRGSKWRRQSYLTSRTTWHSEVRNLEDEAARPLKEYQSDARPPRSVRFESVQQIEDSDSSVDVWSVDDESASVPIKFTVNSKRYLHPALPPGWEIKVSKSRKRPFYMHPDHGATWFCPVVLPPKSESTLARPPKREQERIQTPRGLRSFHHSKFEEQGRLTKSGINQRCNRDYVSSFDESAPKLEKSLSDLVSRYGRDPSKLQTASNEIAVASSVEEKRAKIDGKSRQITNDSSTRLPPINEKTTVLALRDGFGTNVVKQAGLSFSTSKSGENEIAGKRSHLYVPSNVYETIKLSVSNQSPPTPSLAFGNGGVKSKSGFTPLLSEPDSSSKSKDSSMSHNSVLKVYGAVKTVKGFSHLQAQTITSAEEPSQMSPKLSSVTRLDLASGLKEDTLLAKDGQDTSASQQPQRNDTPSSRTENESQDSWESTGRQFSRVLNREGASQVQNSAFRKTNHQFQKSEVVCSVGHRQQMADFVSFLEAPREHHNKLLSTRKGQHRFLDDESRSPGKKIDDVSASSSNPSSGRTRTSQRESSKFHYTADEVRSSIALANNNKEDAGDLFDELKVSPSGRLVWKSPGVSGIEIANSDESSIVSPLRDDFLAIQNTHRRLEALKQKEDERNNANENNHDGVGGNDMKDSDVRSIVKEREPDSHASPLRDVVESAQGGSRSKKGNKQRLQQSATGSKELSKETENAIFRKKKTKGQMKRSPSQEVEVGVSNFAISGQRGSVSESKVAFLGHSKTPIGRDHDVKADRSILHNEVDNFQSHGQDKANLTTGTLSAGEEEDEPVTDCLPLEEKSNHSDSQSNTDFGFHDDISNCSPEFGVKNSDTDVGRATTENHSELYNFQNHGQENTTLNPAESAAAEGQPATESAPLDGKSNQIESQSIIDFDLHDNRSASSPAMDIQNIVASTTTENQEPLEEEKKSDFGFHDDDSIASQSFVVRKSDTETELLSGESQSLLDGKSIQTESQSNGDFGFHDDRSITSPALDIQSSDTEIVSATTETQGLFDDELSTDFCFNGDDSIASPTIVLQKNESRVGSVTARSEATTALSSPPVKVLWRYSSRILHPPHPLCSLQNLDQLLRAQKGKKAKQQKKRSRRTVHGATKKKSKTVQKKRNRRKTTRR